ncbi:unnamed protein product [Effrenium voratum]|nr:unnamed protein product [Effrenium voratum]
MSARRVFLIGSHTQWMLKRGVSRAKMREGLGPCEKAQPICKKVLRALARFCPVTGFRRRKRPLTLSERGRVKRSLEERLKRPKAVEARKRLDEAIAVRAGLSC